MKQWITPAYTFTPGGSGVGTLDLSGISSFDIKRLVAVNNLTRDEVIYSPGTETSKGFTNVTGTTITLQFDTTGMNSADRLAVIYDDAQLVQGLTDTQLRATPVPVSGTVSTGGLTDAELRATAVPVSGTFFQATQPVSASSLPLPTGAATAALQTQPGVDIGDVTINNASGASAVNIQDGGNSITVDGTVSVSGSVAVTGPLTDAQLRASVVPVSLTSTTITGTVASTQSGSWSVGVNNASGASAVNIQDGGNSITVDGSVAISSVIPGTGATNLGKAEDDPSAAGDVGVKVLGIRQDTLASVVSANGDYSCMTVDRYGRNRVLVYENEVAPLGVYYYSSSAFVVQAAADAATAGRCWLINPVGSAVTLKVKRILFQCQLGSALVAVTSPRITIERVTFTGTASGATIAPSKRKTSDATNVGSLRTASTGLTLTAGAEALNFLPVASATAVAYNTPVFSSFDPVSESEIELAAGEGLVVRQADAGTAADTRRFTVHFVVMEY